VIVTADAGTVAIVKIAVQMIEVKAFFDSKPKRRGVSMVLSP
jgi:hypothetical protein